MRDDVYRAWKARFDERSAGGEPVVIRALGAVRCAGGRVTRYALRLFVVSRHAFCRRSQYLDFVRPHDEL
jgi:hypothetical protein